VGRVVEQIKVDHGPLDESVTTCVDVITQQLVVEDCDEVSLTTSIRSQPASVEAGRDTAQGSGDVQSWSFRLVTVRGSLLTHTWNTYARIDEEIALQYSTGHDNDFVDHENEIWHIYGVDALNTKVEKAVCNWGVLREVMVCLRIDSVGLLEFARLFSMILLRIPCLILKGWHIRPMPASFM
jgi:hypothetical protein